jgi:hypothetical protein
MNRTSHFTAGYSASEGAGDGAPPELADIGRLARRLVHRAVAEARAEEGSVSRLLRDHLGAGSAGFPVVVGAWPAYDQVNVQAGLDAWLSQPDRAHEVVGLTGFRHTDFGLADLMQTGRQRMVHVAVGSVATQALAAGPDGQTRRCVQCALYLVSTGDSRMAVLVRGPEEHGPIGDQVRIEAIGASEDDAQRALDEIRRLGLEHNVFRGQVVSFGGDVFGPHGFRFRGSQISFLSRPQVGRDQVILPAAILDGIEQQVLGVARHSARLRASGQHVKRGVLLHGAPGTGKSHTLRYLLSQLREPTIVVLSGAALGMISEACSIARSLQPALVVIEDVDLIAEERMPHGGSHPLLFQLLNEMDGLAADADVAFVLTTNRPDMLEQALVQRPGRVDHAALLPLPDADARRRLLGLYRGSLDLAGDVSTAIARTEGVTASFIKELLRRAALLAAEHDGDDQGQPLRVTDAQLNAALDQLLDTRNELTMALLGGRPDSPQAEQAV